MLRSRGASADARGDSESPAERDSKTNVRQNGGDTLLPAAAVATSSLAAQIACPPPFPDDFAGFTEESASGSLRVLRPRRSEGEADSPVSAQGYDDAAATATGLYDVLGYSFSTCPSTTPPTLQALQDQQRSP